MATKTTVRVVTDDPAGLLDQIKQEIDNSKIDTWAYDADGDFTHTANQWNKKAWLHPDVSGSTLELKIIWPKNSPQDATVCGVYLGRYIEMLVTHFPGIFASASAV